MINNRSGDSFSKQLDSWWYYKGKNGGVTQWVPRPDVFPNGIEPVVQATGWRVVGHNRYW